MENYIECTCVEVPTVSWRQNQIRTQMINFLTSFSIEGAEYLSKTK